MLKILKWLLYIFGITVVLPVLFFAFLFYVSGGDLCSNVIHAELPSPDNKYKAVIFQRDCGATSGFSTQISIVKADKALPNDSGNIFVIKGHPETHAPELTWRSNQELLIDTRLDGSEYKAEQRFGLINPVSIRYAPAIGVATGDN